MHLLLLPGLDPRRLGIAPQPGGHGRPSHFPKVRSASFASFSPAGQALSSSFRVPGASPSTAPVAPGLSPCGFYQIPTGSPGFARSSTGLLESARAGGGPQGCPQRLPGQAAAFQIFPGCRSPRRRTGGARLRFAARLQGADELNVCPPLEAAPRSHGSRQSPLERSGALKPSKTAAGYRGQRKTSPIRRDPCSSVLIRPAS